MRIVTLLLTVLLCSTAAVAYAAPKRAKPAKATPKPAKAPEAFYIVSCASQCLPTGVRLSWSDGWTAPDGKKLQKSLEQTCVGDLRAAGCKQPQCSCTAKLAAASQPASRPAITQSTKVKLAKKAKASGDDLPPPRESRVEAMP
jgi:hypothetical protein